VKVVKVKLKVVEDNTGIYSEVPALLDNELQVVKPLLEYVLKLKRHGRSASTLSKCVDAAKLLLEYMEANCNCFHSPQHMFEIFSSRLYTGTINNDGLDPSKLFWLPRSLKVVNSYIYSLTSLTDWLASNQKGEQLNNLIAADNYAQRLNYAAWFRKNQYDFLGHIKDKYINNTVRQARNIKGKPQLGITFLDAIEFPECHFENFYFNGFRGAKDRRVALRDLLILLLMHGGGLRESETLHLWLEDVSINPLNPNSVIVRIYHPEYGKAPNNWRSRSGQMNRAAYLKEQYALSPRNTLYGKKRVGWKSSVVDHQDHYIEVYWFPEIFGEIFNIIWKDYIRFLISIDRSHPYAFICFHRKNIGNPYELNAFQYNYSQALKRIGLKPCKAAGLSPHSHRHSYGRRLRRAGVPEIVIKKCLHHASLESQVVYTTPTIKEVTKHLNEATIKLLNPNEPEELNFIPSWDLLLKHGFQDIDPDGFYSGKHPKLGRIV